MLVQQTAPGQASAAQARVNHATGECARSQRLWDEKAIGQREPDDRQNAMREAEANLQVAGLSLGYAQVRAPVSGRIGRLEVSVGNLIAAGPGAPVLTSLVSVSPISASFDADERTVTHALQGLHSGGTSARQVIERIPGQISASRALKAWARCRSSAVVTTPCASDWPAEGHSRRLLIHYQSWAPSASRSALLRTRNLLYVDSSAPLSFGNESTVVAYARGSNSPIVPSGNRLRSQITSRLKACHSRSNGVSA